MRFENINEVGIDELGKLYVKPEKETFEFIYRYAAEIHWEENMLWLYSPLPRQEMTYYKWYLQILLAVKYEYGVELQLNKYTKWNNIPNVLKEQINLHSQ